MNLFKLVVLTGTVCFSFCLMAGNRKPLSVTLTGTSSGPVVLAAVVPEFSFHLPQMSGNFRLGIVREEVSKWPEELSEVSMEEEEGQLTYILKDDLLLENGSVTIKVASLTGSSGLIMEVTPENVPKEAQLFWSFGGCTLAVLPDKEQSHLEPEFCKDNVFSVEGGSFTVYYGEEMNFRVYGGITPPESEIFLSDARRQETPLQFLRSGKDTDAPALAATVAMENGKKLYFCCYRRSRSADYAYYMLPGLFLREYESSDK